MDGRIEAEHDECVVSPLLRNSSRTRSKAEPDSIFKQQLATCFEIVIASAAKQSIPSLRLHGLLRCARNDGEIHVRIPATPCARVLHQTSPNKIRGRGERRVPAAPTASCAKVESTRVSTADTPEHPAFPHAMVLTVSFALSPGTGLDCPRRRRNEAPLIGPVGQEAPSAALTPASGRQDHTTSPSAGHIIRLRAV